MNSDFIECLDFTLLPENDGQPYHVDIHDPGGATIQGITYYTYKSIFKNRNFNDFKHITQADIQSVYKDDFWNIMKCDEVQRGIDLMLFDFGVTAGTYRSIKVLQKCLNVNVDGIFGEITLSKLLKQDSKTLINSLYNEQINFYKSLNTYKYFGKGWTNRTNRRLSKALEMVGEK